MRKVFFIIILLKISVLSQTVSGLKLDEIINYFVRLSSEEEESSQLYDYFENIHEHPIDLNSADYSELSRLPILDYYSIGKIIEYRKRRKKFNSVEELYQCGIRKEVAEMVIPFVTVESKSANVKVNYGSIKTRSYGIANYPLVNEPDFLGNEYKVNNRVKYNYHNMIYVNALTDKDAGEKSLADFYSYNLYYRGKGIVRKIILGSYIVEFGQGLAIWGPYSFSKSADAVGSVVKNPHGVTPYSSSGENRFLYGAAAEFAWNNFTLTSFYSSRKSSAVVDSLGFTALNMSGLFRTQKELRGKDNLKINTVGAIAGYRNSGKNFQVKFLYLRNSFSLPFYSKLFPDKFTRDEISFGGFFKYRLKLIQITGEISFTNGAAAQNYSAQIFVSRNVNVITGARYYHADYFSLFSNGFGERKNTNNELGIYNGIRITTHSGKLNFYYDFNKTLFRTSTEPFPVKRNDFLIDYYSPRFLSSRIRLRYHREEKEHYLALENYATKSLTQIVTEKFRFALYYRLGSTLRLSSEMNVSSFKDVEKRETGYAITEEIRSEPFNNLIVYGRIAYFDTPSFDSRIYLYENDINGVFNMGMLYGKGVSEYLLIKYEIFHSVYVSAKYSEVHKVDWNFDPTLNNNRSNTKRRIAVEVGTKFGK